MEHIVDAFTPAFPIAIIGAGPVGLAAAAHLLERGQSVVLLEAGTRIAAHLEAVRHVHWFSPWRYNLDPAAMRMLLAQGWKAPPLDALPSAGELVDHYLAPLAALAPMAGALRLGHRVIGISRHGIDKVQTRGRTLVPFVVRVQSATGQHAILARAIIDASGTWSQPNPLGADGMAAEGEHAMHARIAYGLPDVLGQARDRYAGRRTLVVGSGHSAAGTLVALAQLAEEVPGTALLWARRGAHLDRLLADGVQDQLPARGQLGRSLSALHAAGRLTLHSDCRIGALRAAGTQIAVQDMHGVQIAAVDEIVCATGSRPDLSITRELRVRHDPSLECSAALAPLIDPNEHSCGTVPAHGYRALAHPEHDYFAVGAKSYGRAPNFLLATGYEQVRSIAAALAGDMAAAEAVQLVLPQTGVCGSDALNAQTGAPSCCAPAPARATGCCG